MRAYYKRTVQSACASGGSGGQSARNLEGEDATAFVARAAAGEEEVAAATTTPAGAPRSGS